MDGRMDEFIVNKGHCGCCTFTCKAFDEPMSQSALMGYTCIHMYIDMHSTVKYAFLFVTCYLSRQKQTKRNENAQLKMRHDM